MTAPLFYNRSALILADGGRIGFQESDCEHVAAPFPHIKWSRCASILRKIALGE